MQLIDSAYFPEYQKQIGNEIPALVQSFDFAEKTGNLGYSTQVSAVYSSAIEGNTIDLNSFMNYKLSAGKFKPHKDIQEIENLIQAYEFAQLNPLTEKNFLHCHKLLSETLVLKSQQGKYRTGKIGVFGQSGLVYLAIEPEFVKDTMKTFFNEITALLKQKLSIEKTFYYASFIHLKFAHIHPFQDGNGRAARLLEKWFLAQKLGEKFWQIPAEKCYKEQQPAYYQNINLGVNYYELNYRKCLPFLLMLPNCLR